MSIDKKRDPNHLIDEESPYLLQHAYNPVDWYPWSEEAFKTAKTEDKPIFLSIGYSTCHWCHVMERESFEDEEVAEILNRSFVSIKVDREERPDIDNIYMTVCQSLTGRGGWPLTIIMTPEKKPFFAGTYFPKETGRGQPGLMSILTRVEEAWKKKRESLLKRSEEILSLLQRIDGTDRKNLASTEELSDSVDEAFADFKRNFDEDYGGFGTAPKFPTSHNLMFLLRYWKATGEEKALEMVEATLNNMYRGGIYDHVGYGFARYSTDEKWLVPHFEKMLYDNALLAVTYLEAYQVIGKEEYAEIAREIFSYILRDMTADEGGFYSAEDADSEGEEGKFYVWTPKEIKEVLGEKRGKEFCQVYNITAEGNFEGKSIPNLIDTGLDKLEVDKEFATERRKLFEAREKRVHPHKDDKILTSWNGLMIAALAVGARVLDNDYYQQAAKEAVEFIWQNLRRDDGRLLVRYRNGEVDYPGYVDDYAFFIWGLIELYETTFEAQYLEKAAELNDDLIGYFWDKDQGGLYFYGYDSEELLTRPKEIYDGAIPSGNSVATLNFLRLAKLVGDVELEEKAQQQFKYFGNQINNKPIASSYFLLSWLFAQNGGREIVVVGERDEPTTEEMLQTLHQKFLPFTVSLLNTKGEREKLSELVPFAADQMKVEGKSTAYICEDFTCQKPINDFKQFRERL